MSKKLFRSRQSVVIAGVASGLADYLDVDPTLVRLLWVFTGLLAPEIGVILYLIAWVLVPQEPAIPDYIETEQVDGAWRSQESPEEGPDTERQKTFGIILVVIGLVFLARRIIPNFVFAWTWPLVLIAFGIYLLFQERRGK